MRGLFDREIYLDIETQRLSHEVEGGWRNIQAFGVAVAVTWDRDSGFRHWFEEQAKHLIAELENFTHIITYNGNRFDLEVLRAYGSVDRLRQCSFDVLEELHRRIGRRVKLDQLAKETLGSQKSGDGTQAVGWWRAGDKARVAAYCEQDVAILRDVVEHGRAKGYVVVSSKHVTVGWL
ncbi:MAG TPA: ribonuclease H-like domain-containing protein [Candidatus Acidoferrum sp.]|jgi:DEAD/DEAH box helicase domain-containing protein|nr:ribonuclease H-like domain-containing protein [Candidatus Acidoferrum sp.]